VHERVEVLGETRILKHHLLHYGMPTISKQLRNLDRYTGFEASELARRGIRFHWWNVIFRPPAAFAFKFLWKQGFRAGFRGVLIAALTASSVFWAHAKLWETEELGLESGSGETEP
jgi:hypothetical protein